MSYTVVDFVEGDHPRWIFPLRSSLAYATVGHAELHDHITNSLLNDADPNGFVTGNVAFSRKDQHHLRRVLVLDPIATFFLYDFVLTNRQVFRKPRVSTRTGYGPAFHAGEPVDAFAEYHEFRRQKYELIARNGAFAQTDIFNCFNSFYHHDVTSFVSTKAGSTAGDHLGQFLRELNAGVSVACFPQGLYPAKIIGNAYLGFIEESRHLRVNESIRFLDDIVLFASSRIEIDDQILELQQLLDARHLALNDSKTKVGDSSSYFRERNMDRIKLSLVRKREAARSDYDDDDDDDDAAEALTTEEREYLADLIQQPNVAQEDVELALTLMRDDPGGIELVLEPVLDTAPHLLRGLHRFMVGTSDGGETWGALVARLSTGRKLPEHDLFWYARILIDCFEFDQSVADLLINIYERSTASPIVKAAILETPELDHGLADLKERELRGSGNLLVQSAAMVGLTQLERGKRNQLFKYVGRQGVHAYVLSRIASKMVA